jgi:hypothetical protein
MQETKVIENKRKRSKATTSVTDFNILSNSYDNKQKVIKNTCLNSIINFTEEKEKGRDRDKG